MGNSVFPDGKATKTSVSATENLEFWHFLSGKHGPLGLLSCCCFMSRGAAQRSAGWASETAAACPRRGWRVTMTGGWGVLALPRHCVA